MLWAPLPGILHGGLSYAVRGGLQAFLSTVVQSACSISGAGQAPGAAQPAA